MIRYPYDRWFKKALRQKVTIWRGFDYFCTTTSMNTLIRNAARFRGFHMSASIKDDYIEFRTSKPARKK